MPKAYVYSSDRTLKKACSFEEANRLLRLGKARIVKYYPFTLQRKAQDQNADPAAEAVSPAPNVPNPILTIHLKRPHVENKDEFANIF